MAIVTDWSKYAPYFTEAEFRCKHTGLCYMEEDFLDRLLQLRIAYGRPMKVTSGYRHPTHPEEAKKGHSNGEHTKGCSADIGLSNPEVYIVASLAMQRGFTRIGVSQKSGSARFLHLGIGGPGLATPALWSY